SRYFKKKTRQQVIATVPQFIDANIRPDFTAVNDKNQLSKAMSNVMEMLYEWSLTREYFDYKQLLALLEVTAVGTCHLMDDICWDMRTVKDIIDVDFETGKIKCEEKDIVDFKGTRCEIVPNEEIYPGDDWTHNIQEQ